MLSEVREPSTSLKIRGAYEGLQVLCELPRKRTKLGDHLLISFSSSTSGLGPSVQCAEGNVSPNQNFLKGAILGIDYRGEYYRRC